MGNKIGYIAVKYRSPSQTASGFANFLENFEKLLYQIQQFRSSFVVILFYNLVILLPNLNHDGMRT